MDSWTKGLLRLREPGVHIRCREDDLHLVQAVIQSACEIYANKAKIAYIFSKSHLCNILYLLFAFNVGVVCCVLIAFFIL
jgi:hypothetical protein